MRLTNVLVVISVALAMHLHTSMGANRKVKSSLRAVPPPSNPLLEVKPPLSGAGRFKGLQKGHILFDHQLLYNTNNQTNKYKGENKGAFPFYVNDKHQGVLELFKNTNKDQKKASYQQYVYDKEKHAYVHGDSAVSFSMRGANKGLVREDINGVQFNGHFEHEHVHLPSHHQEVFRL